MNNVLRALLALLVFGGVALADDSGPVHRQPAQRDTPVPAQAFTIAVLGDAFAEALLEGLRAGLGSDPAYAVVNVTHAPFGLAAERFDWTATARALLSARHVGAAVVMVGANDVVPLRDGTAPVDPGTPRWDELYGARVAEVCGVFRAAHIPLTWVGLPIVSAQDTAAAYADLNEIIRTRATQEGATYVDSWDAFTDEAGRYDPDGPDRDGHPAKLRTGDGRDFTRLGSIKLASFVEGDLRRERMQAVTDLALVANVVLPSEPDVDNDVNAQIRRELGLAPSVGPAASKSDRRGPIIMVTAPPMSPGGLLVTTDAAPSALPGTSGGSIAERALAEGRPLAPKPGRIDDFSWPRR